MAFRKFTFLFMFMCIALAGCSDDSGDNTTKPDKGVTPDQKVAKPDQKVAKLDMAADTGTTADKGTDGATTPDVGTKKDGQQPDTGTVTPDKSTITPDQSGTGPANSKCSGAKALTFSGGKASVTGDTTGASDEYAGTVNCGYSTYTFFKGPQVYYSFAATAGKTYRILLKPDATFYSYMYVFPKSDCGSASKINASCGSKGVLGDYKYVSSSTSGGGSIYFKAPKTQTYIIAVDSSNTTSSYYGTFKLEVSDFKTASNFKCSAARKMTFVSGKASVKGDTTGVLDEYATVKCGSYTMDGPQLYYEFSTKADRMYKVSATATNSSTYMYIFPKTACGSATSISTACSSGGATGTYVYVSYTSGGSMVFNPGKAGTYLIAMDNTYTKGPGPFTIDIEEKQVATNGTCAKAKALTFTSGKASVTGDTTGVADQYSGKVNCGYSTYTFFKGGQTYYSFVATAGQTYRLDLTPTFYSYLYVFPKSECGTAAKINTACGSKGVSGDYKYITSSGGSLYFKAAKTQTYVIAVDSTSSTSSSYYGTFKLDVSKFKPATNGTCAKAKALTLTGGKVTVSGDTSGTTDEYTTLKCGSTIMDGPQVYYSFTAKAKQGYLISLSPKFTAKMYVVRAASCGSATTMSTDCSSSGSTGDYGSASSGSTGSISFKSTTGGSFIVAVDSTASTTAGAFSMTIKEFKAPKNDTCATAKKITLVSGKATVTDYKTGASNKLAKCGSTSLPATDLFYKFTPITGKTYKITFKPVGTNGGRFGVWDGAHNCVSSAVETACGKLGSKYVTKGSSGSLSITATSGDIYMVADGILTSLYNVYDYTFEIAQQ